MASRLEISFKYTSDVLQIRQSTAQQAEQTAKKLKGEKQSLYPASSARRFVDKVFVDFQAKITEKYPGEPYAGWRSATFEKESKYFYSTLLKKIREVFSKNQQTIPLLDDVKTRP
ncbi:MAG: hypothetical protein HYZ47_00630 [Simkania negevensis]|nr:hypothetical protein [Simkania negevensis]